MSGLILILTRQMKSGKKEGVSLPPLVSKDEIKNFT